MIETRYGNVLDVERGIIVHCCNCQGVMGSGIALEVKNRFPEAYKAYKDQELAGEMKLGNCTFVEVADDKFIVNALGQHLYGSSGRFVSYDALTTCFEKVRELARHLNTHRPDNGPFEILFPKIGAVRAGGNWEIIKVIIDETIPDSIPKKIYYEYVPPGGV